MERNYALENRMQDARKIQTVTIPEKLNGYPVSRFSYHANGYATVMVEKPGEYVVATWWPELNTCWMWGHYFPASEWNGKTPEKALAEANACFAEVDERNAGR